jgi:hypothetical protein
VAHFYADENFPRPVVESLRQLGHDVLTVQGTGGSGEAVSDEDVLAFAVSQGRTVLTLNRRHFVRLHESRPDHAGVIVCTFDPDFDGQAHRIHQAVRERQHLAGQLIRVNRPPP